MANPERPKGPIMHGEINYKFPTVIGEVDGRPIFDPETQNWLKESAERDRIEFEKRQTKTQEIAVEPTEITRDLFGEGINGDIAYEIVISGSPCEAYTDVDKSLCGKKPIGTVDVDISGDVEFFTYCSTSHARLVKEQLYAELRAQGILTAPSKNGWGRNNDKSMHLKTNSPDQQT